MYRAQLVTLWHMNVCLVCLICDANVSGLKMQLSRDIVVYFLGNGRREFKTLEQFKLSKLLLSLSGRW